MSSLQHHMSTAGAKKQDDGSYIHTNGDVWWYNAAGDVHRSNGPAIIKKDGEGVRWFIDNRGYSFHRWIKFSDGTVEEKAYLVLKYG